MVMLAMKRIWKKILFGLSIFIALIVLSGLVISFFFHDQVKTVFQDALNKSLNGELILNGDAGFSLFRSFPNAEMSFEDVILKGSNELRNDTLLSAGRIAFTFNPFSLISGNYDIKKLIVEDADLYLHMNKNRQVNYDLIAADTSNTEEKDAFSLDIREARLVNVKFNFDNEFIGQNILLNIENCKLDGSLNSEDFALKVNAGFILEKYISDQVRVTHPVSLGMSLGMHINLAENEYIFEDGFLKIGDDLFYADGKIIDSDDGVHYDVELEGMDITLDGLLQLMPEGILNNLQGFDSKGKLYFKSTIQGIKSQTGAPHVNVEFELQEGTVLHPDINHDVENVWIKGSLNNGPNNKVDEAILSISEFKGELKGDPFSMQFELRDFTDPSFKIAFNGVVHLDMFEKQFKSLGLQSMTGKVNLNKVNLSGNINDLAEYRDMRKLIADGSIGFEDVAFQYNDRDLKILAGSLELDKDHFYLKGIDFRSNESDLYLDGQLENAVSFVAKKIKGQPDNTLGLQLNARSGYLNIEDLLFTPDEKKEDSIISTEDSPLVWLEFMKGDINVSVDTVVYKTFSGEDALLDIRLSSYFSKIEKLNIKTCQGDISLTGMGRIINDKLNFEFKGICKGLDMQQSFSAFDNFWQDFLADENISGRFNAEMDIYFSLDRQLQFVQDNLYVKGNVFIEKGKLTHFKPLEDLAGFVKVNELKEVEFSSIKNTIHIFGDRIIIPVMFIQSTAMNLWIGGTHWYNDSIDYQIKVNFMDVLSRKFSIGKTKLKHAEKRKDGLFNSFVLMHGTVDDPVFEYNRKEVLNKFEVSREYVDEDFLKFIDTVEKEQKKSSKEDDEPLEYIDWDK
jgi:AsmA family/AsmA-like C-terminal region